MVAKFDTVALVALCPLVENQKSSQNYECELGSFHPHSPGLMAIRLLDLMIWSR